MMDQNSSRTPEGAEAESRQLKILSRQLYIDLQRAKSHGDAEEVERTRQWISDLTQQRGMLQIEAGLPGFRKIGEWLAEEPRPGRTRAELLADLEKLQMVEDIIRLMRDLRTSLDRKDYEWADRVIKQLAQLGGEDSELYGIA